MQGIQDGATRIFPQLDIKTKLGLGVKDGQPPTPDATPHPDDIEAITAPECFENFDKFIEHEKPGLRSFYNEDQLKELSINAADMVNKLRKKKCGKETSKQLSILCLYDLVMLVDDSSSMSDEEGGKRIEIVTRTMKKITMVYDLARPAPDQGLVSVKFINSMKGYKNIDNRRVSPVLKKHTFWGTTQIGSALQKKVLESFVFNAPMKKPLLIMTITDGGPEGESKHHLRNVINKCVERLEGQKLNAQELGAQPHWGAGKDAVAFHFSRVGNDRGAADLLAELDESCDSVDCLRAEYALDRLSDKGSQWDVLPKLLLGAIVSAINHNDEEESGKAEEPLPVHAETLEDETVEPDNGDTDSD